MGGGFVLGEVRGCPESGWSRQARWADKEKSNAHGGAGCGVARGAAGVRAMETHVVRRPVKGGPARIGLIKMTMKLNRAGGPGVLWTPGRRPPHRNGGARRLSGYAAKSRSDAPTGGALSEPVPLFPAAVQAANAKGLGPCLSSIQS